MSGFNYNNTDQYFFTHIDTWEEVTQISQDVTHSSLWIEKVDTFLGLSKEIESSSSQTDSIEYVITQEDSWEEHVEFCSNSKNLDFV